MSVATMRPHSSRNAADDRPRHAIGSLGGYISQIGLTSIDPVGGPGNLGRDLDGLVEVLAVDQVEAAHLLLGLRERPIRRQGLAVPDPHGGGVGRRPQTLAALQDAPFAHLVLPPEVVGGHRRPFRLGPSPAIDFSSEQISSA